MRKRPWAMALLVSGGVVIGIGVAGVPSRQKDAPITVKVETSMTTTSTSTTTTTTPTTSLPSTTIASSRRP